MRTAFSRFFRAYRYLQILDFQVQAFSKSFDFQVSVFGLQIFRLERAAFSRSLHFQVTVYVLHKIFRLQFSTFYKFLNFYIRAYSFSRCLDFRLDRSSFYISLDFYVRAYSLLQLFGYLVKSVRSSLDFYIFMPWRTAISTSLEFSSVRTAFSRSLVILVKIYGLLQMLRFLVQSVRPSKDLFMAQIQTISFEPTAFIVSLDFQVRF